MNLPASPFRYVVIPVVFAATLLNACAASSSPTSSGSTSATRAAVHPVSTTTSKTPDKSAGSKSGSGNRTTATVGHVFIVILENHGYKQIIGSRYAPYLNHLAAAGGLATNYTAIRHPSLPNYIAMTSGSTFGIKTDCTKCGVKGSSIADQLETAGVTWKAYEESMPKPCFTGPYSGEYSKKHNPFVYYKPLVADAHRCKQHVVGFDQLKSDMQADTLPQYSIIVPNELHDMHTGSIQQGDKFLKGLLPKIFATSAYSTDGALFVTWDEGTDASNRVATIVKSPLLKTPGMRSNVAYTHYSLLKTVEEIFGLPYLRNANLTKTKSMVSEFFS